jgi:hypothetical protein
MPLSKDAAMSRKIQFICLFVLLGLLSLATQPGFAQADPLKFGNNFFVTGDYIVAGAYGMTTKFTTINGVSYAVGTISVPDTNPGITGTKQVPAGAQIVAALLYWQTVEKVGVKPGALGSGQNGYFRPLLSGGPAAPGYAISGTNVSASATVSWSSGGCTGGSTGKLLRTYRADVVSGLPVDANGNSIANGSFEVRLPSVGNSTPLTLGATLVVIYRILSGAGGPNIPLNSIVIYDGDYAQSNTQLTMTQQLQGFYDADANPVSRLTHIVGNGKSNKFQTVYLGSGKDPLVPPTFVALPSLYGKQLPTFPGYYVTWDNPTWTFNSFSQNPPNPVTEDSSYATTQVVPSPSNQGCVSWGAVIVSTTVKNSDNDGILDSWKLSNPRGYCDVAVNPSCSGLGDPAWVDLTGATHGEQDVFLQYDYMCSKVTGTNSCDVAFQNYFLSAAGAASGGNTTYTGMFSPKIPTSAVVTIAGFINGVNNGQFTVVSSTSTQLVVNNASGVAETNSGGIATYSIPGDVNYSFDPRLAVDTQDGLTPHANAIDKVVEAYGKHKIVLHVTPGNAIEENQPPNISCVATDPTCPFPNEPGTVGFSAGLTYIKNQTIDTQTGLLGCTPGTADCVPVFQHGKKDSYHYALFSHAVAVPTWFLLDGSLSKVQQSGSTVTFTTKLPHGLAPILGDTLCSAASGYIGRVTIVFATTNLNLNGTYCAMPVGNPASPNQFAIALTNSSTTATYTVKTDPNLSVANGQVTSVSGYSDVGGQNSVISLGYGGWGPANNPASDGNKWQIKAGTIHHEFGHTMALTHGGTFLNNLANNPPDYTPTYEANCKANVQSSMSYLFQFDLLEVPGKLNAAGQPLIVVDYSEEALPTLAEGSPQGVGVLNNGNTVYDKTAWFQLTSFAGGTPVSPHCDGTPLLGTDQPMSYVSDLTSNFFWSSATGEDINFDGNPSDVMRGHNEWEGTPAENALGLNLQQVSALGTITTTGTGGAGGLKPGGGASGLYPFGGGGGLKPGGGGLKPGGGGLKPGGGSSAEITHEDANSYTRPPRDLVIVQEEASPRYIDLSWFAPTFGTVGKYNIYRSSDGGHTFTLIHSNVGNPPATTYQDTVPCNPVGYEYRVTAVTTNDAGTQQESTPSNTVPASGQNKLTGCYTVSAVTYPNGAVQGSIVPITWTLTDDFYATQANGWASAVSGNPVTNLAASTLVANGPACAGSTTILSKGVPQSGASTFGVNPLTGQFTFNWDTDPFCAGSYTFTLTLDSTQTQTTTSSLTLSIDINDQDTPRITTLALPGGTVGLAYSDILTEDGGIAPFTWTVTGLPTGISQNPAGSANLSGTACFAGGYPVSASVTDAKSNTGSQAFSLKINQATTTTGVTSNANPSVFQQMVTFTVTVAPQYSCTPTGTVTLYDGGVAISPNLSLNGGVAQFTTSALSVGVHSITASYSGDANFTSSASGVYSQTVNKASTQIAFNSVLPSTAFVGQPITISYTFSVVAPGAGSPIPPTGNITVLAGDGSGCMAAAVQGAGACTLSPPPTTAGTNTYTITYAGDPNFVLSGFNGNYTVYQLVFTAQPSNTGVGLTITPAVQVTAEDSSNNTLATFTGGITVAIGAGPGTLSGTTTQSAVSGVATFGDLSINKIANGYTLVASPSGGVPDATSNTFNIDTFYVDGSGNFGTLDLPTGTVSQIGAATVPGSTGMDLTPGLLVYEYNTSNNQLIEITPSTGAATPVGSAGSIPDQATAGALTDGSYFGIDMVTGNLYSIDLTAGATTLVGPTSSALVPAGCSFEASLTGSANVLYYTIGSTGVGTGCTAFTDTLYQINPTSGATTTGVQVTISGSGVNAFVGSAFVGGTLYGFTSTSGGQEYTIDPGTGVATLVANTTVPIVGAGSSQ